MGVGTPTNLLENIALGVDMLIVLCQLEMVEMV